jgi:hypothetical protein
MIQNLRQCPDAPYEERRRNRVPSSAQIALRYGKPADFTDREIESYMLPHPENPSANLRSLYDAIRAQMARDGCV